MGRESVAVAVRKSSPGDATGVRSILTVTLPTVEPPDVPSGMPGGPTISY